MNLFVPNLDPSVNEEALKALFSEFGTVLSAKIVTDKKSGISKGFGFVEIPIDSHFMTSISKLFQPE